MNSSMKILHKDLSFRINGLCFQVHNRLGRFCREKQYGDYLERLLTENNIPYKREFEIMENESQYAFGNRVDFLIDDKIILELKAKYRIDKTDYYQVNRYLESTGLELGLLINFQRPFLKPKRILRRPPS